MNHCYEIEELISFAQDPCQEGNAALAAHLLRCARCNNIYRSALEELATEEVADRRMEDLTGTEYEEARASVEGLLSRHSLWVRVQAFAENLQKQMSFQTKNLSDLLLQPAFSYQATHTFAAAGNRSSRPENDQVYFTFESFARAEESTYWKMRMTLPRIMSNYANMRIQVFDATGNSIPTGVLSFLNRNISISGGLATLPLKDFLANKSCNTISFTFSNGKRSEGTIRFLPDSF